MPLFNSSQFDQAVEKATSELNTSEDWGTILEICDKVEVTPNGPKDCLRSIIKRLNSNVPHHAMQCLTLLDACIKNCGRKFHLEVCSRDFEVELKKMLNKGHHPKVIQKLEGFLKKWTEEVFTDPELSLIPSLYNSIKSEREKDYETVDVSKQNSHRIKDSTGTVSASEKEEDDLAKAIELSLKESGSTPSNTLYPSVSNAAMAVSSTKPMKEQKKMRALYDFSAAEDNELTLKAGEIVIILDDSDSAWWYGSNHRGEGLFPANFVTSDLSAEPEKNPHVEKSVKFDEAVIIRNNNDTPRGEVVIDEEKIDAMLHAIHESDPTGAAADSAELLSLEEECLAMGPLIDQELEKIDHRHASLTATNQLLVEALNSYQALMKDYQHTPPHPAATYIPYQMPDMRSYHPPPQQPPHVYNSSIPNSHVYHPGEQFQPTSLPPSRVLPNAHPPQMISGAEPHVPYDISIPTSYASIPAGAVPSGNFQMPMTSRDASGLYYGDIAANTMQHGANPISMHQPML